MLLTRATDNRLKTFFTNGEVRYGDAPFQGKGFRSLGQEAIYAAGIRLRRGEPLPQGRRPGRATSIAPLIRDLGVALAMRPEPETVRHGAVGADGQGRPADERQGSAHRRSRLRHPARRRAARHRRADDRRHGPGVRARGIRARGAVLHRRRRLVARRVARGDQPVRGARSCRRCSASRTTRPRCRRRCAISPRSACSPTRRPATAFPGITIDGTDPDAIAAAFAWAVERARAGHGPGADRARVRCACAATRITTTCCISARIRRRRGTTRRSAERATRTASATRTGPRAIRLPRMPRGSKPTALIDAGAARRDEARGRSAGRARRRSCVDRRALAGAGRCGRRRVRRRTAARPRRSARPSVRGADRARHGAAAARAGAPFDRKGSTFLEGVMLGVARRAARRSRACSSSARTSAARTATRSCCCGRCSRSSAIASSIRRSPKAPCSAPASAPRSPASGRSARCSSTTSSRPASTSS